VRLGIISDISAADPDADYLVVLSEYFLWLGADAVDVMYVDSIEAADDPAIATTLASLDAVFLAPKSAADAYDWWNDTAIETGLVAVWSDKGGGLGGTGPGAVLLAEHALAGGMDLISTDIMGDAHTEFLDDLSDGGSAIHSDFIAGVPNTLVDTSFTGLGKLVHMAGALARLVDETGLEGAVGLGIDESTGVVIEDGSALVIGDAGVALVRATPSSVLIRESEEPLIWTHLLLDRLTEGWRFDVASGEVDEADPPPGAESVAWDSTITEMSAEDWHVDGHEVEHEERFGWVVARDEEGFDTRSGIDTPILEDVVGILDANYIDTLAINQEAVFRGLYDHIGCVGIMVTYQGRLEHRADDAGVVRFTVNPYVDVRPEPPSSHGGRPDPTHVVMDTTGVRWRTLSTVPSAYDPSGATLYPAGLVGMQLHLLANSDGTGWVYDLHTRQARLE
jgi:cyanophycinase-like exopeptidase